MAKIALFAGSFDPFTRGHEAVVEEALRLFDEDRYKDNTRVRVASYSTLTGDFAREVGATALVRGVRNTVDFEFERTMEATNRELYPELTTVLLVTPAEYMHISSSMVRELLAFGHKVDDYLPQSINIENYINK